MASRILTAQSNLVYIYFLFLLTIYTPFRELIKQFGYIFLASGLHFLATLRFTDKALLSPSRKFLQFAQRWKLAFREPSANRLVFPFGLALSVAAVLTYMMPLLQVIRQHYASAFAGELFLMLCEMSPIWLTLGYVAAMVAGENNTNTKWTASTGAVMGNFTLGILLYCSIMVISQRLHGLAI